MNSIQEFDKESLTDMFNKLDTNYQELLLSISWLSPNESLPIDLLTNISGGSDIENLNQKLGFLVNMGFLQRQNEDFYIGSHESKLILELADQKKAVDNLRTTCKAMHLITHSLGDASEFKPYAKHVEKLASQGQIHKIATAGLLFGLLGRYQLQIGEAEESIKFIRRALLIIEKVSGVESVEHTENLNNLGTALHRIGRFEEAKKCFEQAIIIDKKILDEDDPAVAIGHNNLGQVLIDINSLDGAIIHLEKALEINEKNFGKEDPIVAAGNYNLGMALIVIGDIPRARAQLELSLAKRMKNFGENHLDVADSHHGLGMLFQAIGNTGEAIHHYQEAIRIFEFNKLDDEKLAASYANIGGVFHHTGDMQKANEYYQKALAIFEVFKSNNDKHVRDIQLQLKLTEFGLTMQDLLQKMEAGEPLSDELMKLLDHNFGDTKK